MRLVLRVVEAIVLPTIALAAVLSALRRAYPPPKRSLVDDALDHDPLEPDHVPGDLARIEREVTLGVANTYDFHFRLRPTLRETAAGLLAVRRGIGLDREPDRARAALGDETWQLVRPDRDPPDDRLGGGLQPTAVRRVVESLEAL